MTLSDLPPPGTKRWVIRRKAEVVLGVRAGLLTLEEACERYTLSVEEFLSWQKLIDRHGLRDRVLLTGHVSREVQAAWYANCLAVFFGPHDEDYGFVTLEAMASDKPVITCSDSGGTLEFVRGGETGEIIEPEPAALAEAIDRLAAEPARAARMGREGGELYRSLGLSWERTASTLIERGANP